MTTIKKEKKSVKWDISHSTYYWKIYLDKSNPVNSPVVDYLQGYSKQERQREANDIVHLLKSKILNLYKNGYFARIDRIEIFKRVGDIINQKEDIKLLKLYPNHYETNPNYQDYIDLYYSLFLIDFYTCKKNNLSVEGLIQVKRKVLNNDDRLNIYKISLRNLQELYSYSSRLLINGHANGEVENFIHKYKELKGW